MAFLKIGATAGLVTLCTFAGSSLSNWLFSNSKSATPQTNELKSEIRVMSNEIKSINILEIVCLVAIISVAVVIIVYFVSKIIRQRSEPRVIFKKEDSTEKSEQEQTEV